MKKKKKVEQTVPEADYLEQLQRLQAEFINFRHRVEKEKDLIKYAAKETILLKFLDVKDNFDRAPKLDRGMEMIYKQMLKIFAEENVEEINQDKFDPNYHEAIATDATKGKDEIVEVFKKGYLHNNKVIRPTQVMVGTKEK